jgi:hypothetical protein
MTRSDRVATLEEAKAQFSEELGRVEGVGEDGRGGVKTLPAHPEPYAQNCKREPEQLQQRQIAVYESERHRLRRRCIPKILVKGPQKQDPRQ